MISAKSLRTVIRRSSSTIIIQSRYALSEQDLRQTSLSFSKFMLNRMKTFDGKVAIIDGSNNNQHTFKSAHDSSYQLAEALRKLNLPSGAKIAIMSPNHLDYFTCLYSIGLNGYVSTPVNPLYTEEEIEFQLQLTGAKLVIAHPMCFARVLAVASRLRIPVVEMAASASASAGAFSTLNQLIQSEKIGSIDCDSFIANDTARFDSEETMIIPFSSGTTGKPKGVMLSHKNFVVNLLQCMPLEGQYMLEKDGVQGSCIIPLPYFHIYGTLMAAMANYAGAKTVFMPSFDLVQFLELVQTHKVQRAHLVPPIILALTKHPIVDKYDLSSLRCINSAAAPLGAEVQVQCAERLKCVVKQGWGMTELSPAGCLISDEQAVSMDAIKGSAGVLTPNTFAKIVDPATGQDLLSHQEGEVCIKGPQVMKGYYENEEATNATIDKDGWLHTGDVGHFNDQGFLFITDRCKELIKYKGFQVAPAELEAIIASMPGVKDVVVIPVEDEEAGEIPRAYVVRQDGAAGQTLQAEEVEEFVKVKVAPYKRLRGGVRFTDVIPKTPSGKILRRVQRDLDRAAK